MFVVDSGNSPGRRRMVDHPHIEVTAASLKKEPQLKSLYLKLRRPLLRRGFEIRCVERVGDVYYKVESVPAGAAQRGAAAEALTCDYRFDVCAVRLFRV